MQEMYLRDAGSIPELGGILGEGDSNPLQYSCLENPMDRGAWWVIVHRVAKSQTQLKWLSKHTCTPRRIHCSRIKHVHTVQVQQKDGFIFNCKLMLHSDPTFSFIIRDKKSWQLQLLSLFKLKKTNTYFRGIFNYLKVSLPVRVPSPLRKSPCFSSKMASGCKWKLTCPPGSGEEHLITPTVWS